MTGEVYYTCKRNCNDRRKFMGQQIKGPTSKYEMTCTHGPSFVGESSKIGHFYREPAPSLHKMRSRKLVNQGVELHKYKPSYTHHEIKGWNSVKMLRRSYVQWIEQH